MVQNLLEARNALGMARQDADERFQKKRAQVVALMAAGKTTQAWQSMQTANMYKNRELRLHGMMEQVEQIHGVLSAQQQTANLFSVFKDANERIASMLEVAPLESVDAVLDSLREHVEHVNDVSSALAQGTGTTTGSIDEDELLTFCNASPPLALATEPAGVVKRGVSQPPSATSAKTPAAVSMML